MVRVRFAPSPTGFLHIGSARTAVFNWLFARHEGGKFLLRVEDTDLKRSEDRFLAEILEDLKWLGLDWDEELLFQSRRFAVYRARAEELVAAGRAYRDGQAVLFRVEPGRTIKYRDLIHGEIAVESDTIKDQVLIKSDGSPAYNFSCVVDDTEMGITHILRGDDHISNTPKQILFYEVFGLEPPCFGHMPLILGADGSKLSKRHGGVSVEEYKREGFLPQALANYLILLGWTPPDGREVLPLEEAVRLFDIRHMSSVQARFDLNKLRWINSEYIMKASREEMLPELKARLAAAGLKAEAFPDDFTGRVLDLYRVRMKTLGEFAPQVDFFYREDYDFEEGGRAELEHPDTRGLLTELAGRLERLPAFDHTAVEAAFRAMAEQKGIKAARIIHPARMAVSGKSKGAGLFEIMEVLGRERVLARLRRAVNG